MARKSKGYSVTGIKNITQIFKDMGEKDANNLARSTIHGLASRATKEAKSNIRPYRDTGATESSIKTKRLKSDPKKPESATIIETDEGWAWHFIEFGTEDTPTRHFLRDAKDTVEQDLDKIFDEEYKKKLKKMVERKLKASRGK